MNANLLDEMHEFGMHVIGAQSLGLVGAQRIKKQLRRAILKLKAVPQSHLLIVRDDGMQTVLEVLRTLGFDMLAKVAGARTASI